MIKIINPKNLKKLAVISAATLASASLTTAAFANNKYSSKQSGSSVVQAIHELSNEVKALSYAGVKAVNHTMYQFDKNLPTIMQSNNDHNAIVTNTKLQAYQQTQNDIKNTLEQFPDSTLTYNYQNADVKQALQRLKQRNNLVNQLTIDTPASDTLYSDIQNVGGSSFFTGGFKVSKPKKIYNNYFNFDSLIAPNDYTQTQQKAANSFIEYLTKRYQPLTGNIDFATLRAELNKYKNKPEKLGEILHNFMNSSAYKQYQLSVRSIMASRSVALSNLNKLMQERSPIETTKANAGLASLSETIGVKPTVIVKTNPVTGDKTKYFAYASPLQISNYIANHRVDSKQWYQSMQHASPATVQRETLYVLAEIESQMQRQHIDNERLLATLTAMQLQSSASAPLILRTRTMAVNKEIKTLAGENTKTIKMNSLD